MENVFEKHKVLLLSESFMHYRKSLYNEFFSIFKKEKLNLVVYTDESFATENDKIEEFKFNLYKKKYTIRNIKKIIDKEKPDYIILFWNIYTITTWLTVFYLKFKKLRFVYWSQGYSMLDSKNKIKGMFYKFMHILADSVLLYSENEKRFIASRFMHKVFVANNTINFNDIPKVSLSKKELKEKYNVPFKKIVLFVGRIQERKRLDVLINIFEKIKDPEYGLIIVGKGLKQELLDKVNQSTNILYFGEIYEGINDYFKMSDLFCIPGTNGLGINHAMYWGLPVLTLNVEHNPEIFYLKQGVNGYILNSENELGNKILFLLKNDEELLKLSSKAIEIIRSEASVENMAKGFIDSINYLKK